MRRSPGGLKGGALKKKAAAASNVAFPSPGPEPRAENYSTEADYRSALTFWELSVEQAGYVDPEDEEPEPKDSEKIQEDEERSEDSVENPAELDPLGNIRSLIRSEQEEASLQEIRKKNEELYFLISTNSDQKSISSCRLRIAFLIRNHKEKGGWPFGDAEVEATRFGVADPDPNTEGEEEEESAAVSASAEEAVESTNGKPPAPQKEPYQKRRAANTAIATRDSQLLKWHPHYHVSLTFTKGAEEDAHVAWLKQNLQRLGMRDVNVKKTYKPGLTNWSRIESYCLVSSQCDLAHDFLLAVNHERIDYPPLESNPSLLDYDKGIRKYMNLAVEYTNMNIMKWVPGWYDLLENYYFSLRQASMIKSTNGSRVPIHEYEIPILSKYYSECTWHAHIRDALQGNLHERTIYIRRIRDYMMNNRLCFHKTSQGQWCVYKPVESLRDPKFPSRKPILIDTAHEIFCTSLDDFKGHLQVKSASYGDAGVRFNAALTADFPTYVSKAITDKDSLLPVLRRNDRFVAFPEGWLYLCDDPHNPDGKDLHNPNTPNARKRIQLIQQYCCDCVVAGKCDLCTYYVNLPLWFPLPKSVSWDVVTCEATSHTEEQRQTYRCPWPSPFLRKDAKYVSYLGDPETFGKTFSVKDLVEKHLSGASCYYVCREIGLFELLDIDPSLSTTHPSHLSAARPSSWLSLFEPYRKEPCEKHKWDFDGLDKRTFTCSSCKEVKKATLSADPPSEDDPNYEAKSKLYRECPFYRPQDASRPSWGLANWIKNMEHQRQVFQKHRQADLVLVYEGPTRTGKTAMIAHLAPIYSEDGKKTLFPEEDVMFIGKGQADKLGSLKKNVKLAWLNEFKVNSMDMTEFKTVMEGAAMPARGMQEKSGWNRAAFHKVITINYPEKEVKEITREVVKDDLTGQPIMITKKSPDGTETTQPKMQKVTRKVKVVQKDPWAEYAKDGAIKARLTEFRVEIIPEELDKDLIPRVEDEAIRILVYLMLLRFLDPKESRKWRLGSSLNISRARGSESRTQLLSSNGDSMPALPTYSSAQISIARGDQESEVLSASQSISSADIDQ